LRHPGRGGLSNGDRQHAQKIGKDRACSSGDMLADGDTQTDTYVLITILCHRCCGQNINKQTF